jgi:DNA polymerase-3 subunit gamma/tau
MTSHGTGHGTGSAAQLRPAEISVTKTVAIANNNLETAQDIMTLLEQSGSMILASQVYHHVELVKLEAGVIEFHPVGDAPPRLAQDLGKRLSEITGQRWMGTISAKAGQPTLKAQHDARLAAEIAEVKTDPVVKRVFEIFPGASILSITNKEN